MQCTMNCQHLSLKRKSRQILAPESVKEQYRQMIAKADEDMQESE